jgi:hypothetical protein
MDDYTHEEWTAEEDTPCSALEQLARRMILEACRRGVDAVRIEVFGDCDFVFFQRGGELFEFARLEKHQTPELISAVTSMTAVTRHDAASVVTRAVRPPA